MANLIEVKKIKNQEPEGALLFIYDNDTKEPYKIYRDQENKLPYIKRRIENKEEICQIIESESDVIKLLETNAKFFNCIFLIESKSLSIEYEYVSFSNAIFAEKANFSNTVFTRMANFNNVIFIKDADFSNTKFTKEADFFKATFTKEADFSSVKFSGEADFSQAKFNKGTITFFQAQFLEGINLNGIKTKGIKTIRLNLEQAQLDRIYYSTDTTFKADNRETFLILKSIALKQHDRIKALEFHTEEYKLHQESLKCWENWSDKLILGWEKWTSNFGTSFPRTLLSFFALTIIFYFSINNFDWSNRTLVEFISPTTYKVKDVVYGIVDWWDRWLFLLYKILQITLIYEIIKSLRKFSRNL